MNVLVIGHGGREHAICYALDKAESVSRIYVAKGNDGMRDIATIVDIDEMDNNRLVDFAIKNEIDLTVVGPEVCLSNGIVDAFRAKNLVIFGPTKEAAKIESSKKYAKDLMKKYHIPTACYETFNNYEEALNYVKKHSFPLVIKYDGLAAGKGVVIPNNLQEAEKYLQDMLLNNKFGHGQIVIEDFLDGVEFSYMCFVNENKLYPMPIAQDHKRAFDNDLGPNTGGMGAYSPVSFINDKDMQEAHEIMKMTVDALMNENNPYTGVLYGGLIKTKDGIKVIEFNARFGDPETEVILPRLKSDFGKVLLHVLINKYIKIEWDTDVTLGVVLASKGYPDTYENGYKITGLDDVKLVFHMGTRLENGEYKTNGGRVLFVVGKGKSFKEAFDNAYNDVRKIKCDNLFYRTDIGHHMIDFNGGK